MKRRHRKKRSREALFLATLDLPTSGYPLAAAAFDAGLDEPYSPSPRHVARFRRLGVSLRTRVLGKTSDTILIRLYSPEFPTVSEDMFFFWNKFLESVRDGIAAKRVPDGPDGSS